MLSFSEYLNEARTKTDVVDVFKKLTYHEYDGMINRQRLSVYEIPASKLSLMKKHDLGVVLHFEGKKDGRKHEFFCKGRTKLLDKEVTWVHYEGGRKVEDHDLNEFPDAERLYSIPLKDFKKLFEREYSLRLKGVYLLKHHETPDEYKARMAKSYDHSDEELMKILGL